MRKNILFNTTRQWNPGDQIIMLGILRLLRHLDFNKFIYNRHPSIWGKGKDNSYKLDVVKWPDGEQRVRHTPESIDYYISAGTPEWTPERLEPFFKQLNEHKIPCSFIGVGGGSNIHPELKKLISRADVLTGRDRVGTEKLKNHGGVNLPCPAFCCGERPTIRKNNKDLSIGLVFMSSLTGANRVTPDLMPELIAGYKAIIKEFKNIYIICHYIDEALEARERFPGTPVYYSYDARDFEEFYDMCDITIGPRLHGAILASSLGVPSYIIPDRFSKDKGRRLGGIDPIKTPILDTSKPNNFIKAIREIDIKKESNRLIKLRYKTEIKYLRLFLKNMNSLYNNKRIRTATQKTIRKLEEKM